MLLLDLVYFYKGSIWTEHYFFLIRPHAPKRISINLPGLIDVNLLLLTVFLVERRHVMVFVSIIKSIMLEFYTHYLKFLAVTPLEFLVLIKFFLFLDLPRYLLPDFFTLSLMLAQKRRCKETEENTDLPFLSVIVPAYNEEKSVAKTIRSLLESDYPNKEIIVVDDGSTDSTYEKALPFASKGDILLIRRKKRGGKASCLNTGLCISKGEFIISTDSDTTYDRDCLKKVVRYFSDKKVGAVSGNLRIRNWNTNLLTRLQACEYIITISVGRIWLSRLNILMVVSGAFGAFRRESLKRLGGWDPGIGDDSNVTIKMRKIIPKVIFAPDAVCMTEAPSALRKLYKQRKRWEKNFYRNRLRKHRNLLDFRKFGAVNMLAIISESFFRVILLLLFYFFWGFVIVFRPQSIPFLLFSVFIIYSATNFCSLLIGMILNERRKEHGKLIFYAPLMIFYRLFLRYVRTRAYIEEFFRYNYEEPFYPEHVWKEMPRW